MNPRRLRGLVEVTATRVAGGACHARREAVVVEEPLEIRVAGELVATTLRSPGDDEALALGLLLAEGVISSAADVGKVAHCGRPGLEGFGNVVEVTPGPGARIDAHDLTETRRIGMMTAACGVCGHRNIEALMRRIEPIDVPTRMPLELLDTAVRTLGASQPLFDRTGGLHAAVALDVDGQTLAAAEDVGRHNAVDKVVGRLLQTGQLPRTRSTPTLLCVSSRSGFEIVQKAAVAGFALVLSVSAPSSLAIETATASGLCLVAFAREGRVTVYAHPEHLAL